MLTLMPSAVSTSTAGVPSISGGHLDHDVRPRYHLPEMPSLGDGCSGVVGGAWRDFEADEPVCTVAMVVHGSKNISRLGAGSCATLSRLTNLPLTRPRLLCRIARCAPETRHAEWASI